MSSAYTYCTTNTQTCQEQGIKSWYNQCMENTVAKEVGSRIKKARRKANLTQKEIAQKLNMTNSGFAHCERGINLITLENLIKLPEILNCAITDLLPEKAVKRIDRERTEDPQLQEVIDAWKDLPKFLRDAISTMARDAARENK